MIFRDVMLSLQLIPAPHLQLGADTAVQTGCCTAGLCLCMVAGWLHVLSKERYFTLKSFPRNI